MVQIYISVIETIRKNVRTSGCTNICIYLSIYLSIYWWSKTVGIETLISWYFFDMTSSGRNLKSQQILSNLYGYSRIFRKLYSIIFNYMSLLISKWMFKSWFIFKTCRHPPIFRIFFVSPLPLLERYFLQSGPLTE